MTHFPQVRITKPGSPYFGMVGEAQERVPGRFWVSLSGGKLARPMQWSFVPGEFEYMPFQPYWAYARMPGESPKPALVFALNEEQE